MNLLSDWTALGAPLVGAILLWAAVIKAGNPGPFMTHLGRMGVVDRSRLYPLAVVLLGVEGAWGAALLIGLQPEMLLPATLVLLAALTGLTFWSTSTGRTEDCGCYGGQVDLTPAQSMALNGLYALLIATAWLTLEPSGALAPWEVALAVGAGLGTAGLTMVAQRHQRLHREPLLGRSPLREGRRWKKGWAAGAVDPSDDGEVLVVYLGPTCPHCHRWGRILNVVDEVAGLPGVVGVVRASEEERKDFAETHGFRFPMVTLTRGRMARLVSGVPTSVLVEGGVIRKVWVGSIPEEEFQDRVKRALFPSHARAGAP